MLSFFMIKIIHVSAVTTTFILFSIRGYWMITGSKRLQQRWVRVVPHVVDSLLLASALILAWMIHQYPFETPWLTAKVIGLFAYIGFGTLALKRGRTRLIRVTCLALGLLTFFYIVSVALTKQVVPTSLFSVL